MTLEDLLLKQELRTKVAEAFTHTYNRLTNDKHKAVIMTWHNSGYTMYNKDIALLVGVSQPYVNQIINIFKSNIRKRLEAYING